MMQAPRLLGYYVLKSTYKSCLDLLWKSVIFSNYFVITVWGFYHVPEEQNSIGIIQM